MIALVSDFDERFPELAPLLVFYSKLSAAPVPYGSLNPESKKKKSYYEALLWLLRSDLVIVAPIRVRMRVRPAVKERARAHLIDTRKQLELERAAETEETQRRNLEELIHAMPDEAEFSILEQETSVIASPAECRGIVRPSLLCLRADALADPPLRTPQERAWIDAMSDDKSPEDAELFKRFVPDPQASRLALSQLTTPRLPHLASVRRFFDGITTTHEIQYREGLSRREVSHVLRVYEDDLITIIHP